jgi:uncharacterized membrane protein
MVAEAGSMQEWVERTAIGAALLAEGIAGIVILVAVLRAAWRTVLLGWIRRMGPRAGDPVRLDLGTSRSLALEFLVGADVLRTAVEPSWEELGKLGAIVGIRSVLNFFLERERAALEVELAESGKRKG